MAVSIQPPTYGNDMVMVPRTAEGALLKGMLLKVGTDNLEQVEPCDAGDEPRFVCMQDAASGERVSVSYLVAGKLFYLKANATILKNELLQTAATGEVAPDAEEGARVVAFAAEEGAAENELFLAAYVGTTVYTAS